MSNHWVSSADRATTRTHTVSAFIRPISYSGVCRTVPWFPDGLSKWGNPTRLLHSGHSKIIPSPSGIAWTLWTFPGWYLSPSPCPDRPSSGGPSSLLACWDPPSWLLSLRVISFVLTDTFILEFSSYFGISQKKALFSRSKCSSICYVMDDVNWSRNVHMRMIAQITQRELGLPDHWLFTKLALFPLGHFSDIFYLDAMTMWSQFKILLSLSLFF